MAATALDGLRTDTARSLGTSTPPLPVLVSSQRLTPPDRCSELFGKRNTWWYDTS